MCSLFIFARSLRNTRTCLGLASLLALSLGAPTVFAWEPLPLGDFNGVYFQPAKDIEIDGSVINEAFLTNFEITVHAQNIRIIGRIDGRGRGYGGGDGGGADSAESRQSDHPVNGSGGRYIPEHTWCTCWAFPRCPCGVTHYAAQRSNGLGGGRGGYAATWQVAGSGGGPFGGAGGNARLQVGADGGYASISGQGDTSLDWEVWPGSGGGGSFRTWTDNDGRGGDGGGAGGGCLRLLAEETITVSAPIDLSGAGGVLAGGSGAGGGLLLHAPTVAIYEAVNSLGGRHDPSHPAQGTARHGGTIKLFADNVHLNEQGALRAGRVLWRTRSGAPPPSSTVRIPSLTVDRYADRELQIELEYFGTDTYRLIGYILLEYQGMFWSISAGLRDEVVPWFTNLVVSEPFGSGAEYLMDAPGNLTGITMYWALIDQDIGQIIGEIGNQAL